MKKNLLEKETAESVIARVQRLEADRPPKWGQMTATEMLHHCNKVHQQLLAPPADPSNGGTTLKQYLLRWLVLYFLPRFPKGAQAPRKFRTQGTISQSEFERERETFVSLLRRFAGHQSPIAHQHPYFGKLSTREWGRTSWKHVDHHLRQFGV